MASLYSTRGGPSNLRFSSSSLSYDGRPRIAVAVQKSSVLSTGLNGSSNDKELMQNLNFRLANYLEKVCALEKSNKLLENKIREKLSEQHAVKRDYSEQFNVISSLMKQIADNITANTRLLLEIDNAKLAADDFQVKWSNECALRQFVEKDMNSLQKTKEAHESAVLSLIPEVESLQSELKALKSDHKQEIDALKESLARGKVDVEVNAPQGPDLNSVLADIRTQYEDIIRKNKEEADALFQSQYETVNLKLQKEDQESQKAQDELREKRSFLQSLQLELETANNQINALKGDLENTELRYRNELDRLQGNITQVEQELKEILRTVQNNKLEYEALLKIKETLEAEIAEYRRLLEGDYEEKIIKTEPEPKHPDIRTKKIIKIVTQTLVDGKLVGESSEVEEFENQETIPSL
ncbi:keratin, type I cytoskeletal 18-like [Pelobates fuscus]|uniref:keratin, type I cytoskeletal 18-like n=1 Tax=Pelobates fuscus TaxID=191477 RepID=UPI002FE433A0